MPGYYGEILPPDAIKNVWDGDDSDYEGIRYYGQMEFGYLDFSGAPYELSGDGRTLTINGLADFENPHPDDDTYLYHGAPWVEFNVMLPPPKAVASSTLPSAEIIGESVSSGDAVAKSSTSVVSELVSLTCMISAVLLVVYALALGRVRVRSDED